MYPTLSQSAVYEYLRGQRDIGVASVEALMAAAELQVTAKGSSVAKKPSGGMSLSGSAKAEVVRK
jgi:hypothetical protein